ncbi:hypothetical protein CLV63_12945 [Murinocardiopsis flavida]|uniref:Uncharacterized protein n=1 Tax=Murinocardiopsis flavida TaxID=645275 RepID=A0A2P8CUW7_9ACTN|nr:hypothetical protein [Murinocardiopsis flavida]PSK88756.1 hypothetical protein CLV63_12945 [Murinocardiopsis flavida]
MSRRLRGSAWVWAVGAGAVAATIAGLRIQVLGLGCMLSAPGAPPGGGRAPAPVMDCPAVRFLPDVPVAALLAAGLVLLVFAVVRGRRYTEAGLALAGMLVGGAAAFIVVDAFAIGCEMVQPGSYPAPPPRLWCPSGRFLVTVVPVALCSAVLPVIGRTVYLRARGGDRAVRRTR